jgi:hypothetical protein
MSAKSEQFNTWHLMIINKNYSYKFYGRNIIHLQVRHEISQHQLAQALCKKKKKKLFEIS